MKPDWDKLMAWYETNSHVLIADVNCEGDGKDLCTEINAYPEMKYGDPNNLETYEGERDFNSLRAFVKVYLEPKCSPVELHFCDADQKKEVDVLMTLSDKDLASKIKEKEDAMAAVDKSFEDLAKFIQSKYEKAEKETEAMKEEIKESELRLLKSVRSYKEKDEFEL